MTPLGGSASGTDRRTLGKYHLIASLGQGGMAKVYLALVIGPEGVNKLTVLKVIENERLTAQEGGPAVFWDEARLSARLVHPNIVHTYDVGRIEGQHFLAMEYLEGQTYRMLRARAPQELFPLHETLRILSEVARGLHYAHELRDFHGRPLGVVHRDVSPQNIFLTYDGQVKLIDFGIAKADDADHLTRVGLIKGKLNYIAPEQLRGEVLDRRTDVFALGVLLWEAVARRRLAGGLDVAEVAKVQARIKGEEPNIRAVKPDVSEQLAIIVDRALALNPEERFADAASFADALDSYIESTGERPSAKTLSTWMNSLFEDDRSALHRVIDGRVQSLLQTLPDAGSGDVPAPIVEDMQTTSRFPSAPSLPAQSRRESAAGVADRGWVSWDFAQMGWIAAGLAIIMVSAVITAALLSPSAAPRQGAGDVGAALRTGAVAARAPITAASAPAALRVDPLSTPLNVNVALAVSPAHAELSIDGASVAAPFNGQFVRGAALHRIEASAPGHRPFVRLVPFNQDRRLSISLEPLPEQVKRSSPPRARASEEMRLAAHGGPSGVPAPTLPMPSASARPESASEQPVLPGSVAPGSDLRPLRARLLRSVDTADPYAK